MCKFLVKVSLVVYISLINHHKSFIQTVCFLYKSLDPRVHARKLGLKVKSRSPFKCVVYSVNVSSLCPYLKTNIGMCSYLDHICPVGFAFIKLYHILRTISRRGATSQNLGHLCNIEVS